MNINSATSAIQLGSLSQPQPAARNLDIQSQNNQESSVVKLSTRAIQLNLAETRNQEAGETTAREVAEPAPVQRAENEGGQARRIDTYA